MSWDSKVLLKEGEKLKHISRREKGHLGQTEITTYHVIDVNGNVTGKVELVEHTNVRGLTNTTTVNQWDAEGKMIVNTNVD